MLGPLGRRGSARIPGLLRGPGLLLRFLGACRGRSCAVHGTIGRLAGHPAPRGRAHASRARRARGGCRRTFPAPPLRAPPGP
eukprot:3509966-Alexandrium_andersonii.AAC.1